MLACMPNNIEKLRRARKMSMDALGTAIGVSASTISKIEKEQIRLTADYMQRIAGAMGVRPIDLIDDEHRDKAPERQSGDTKRTAMLPVFGLAAGAPLGNHTMSNDPVEWVPAPSGLASVRDAYALIVTGDSMEPRYFAGEPIFIHPHRPIRPGDHVAIQEAADGGIAVSVKVFVRQTEDHLITRQYNPPAEVKFLRKRIQAVHRVLTPNELFQL